MKKSAPNKRELTLLTNTLISAGISKNVAKALACIVLSKEILSREIEITTGLRQPEVSLAVQELRRRGWVTKRDIKKTGKGRPLHAYRLAIPFAKIVEEIEAEEKIKLMKIKRNIESLHGFISRLSGEL